MTTPTKTQVFKIRRRADGKFSTGGSYPGFHRAGKSWTNRAALNLHLTLVRDMGRYYKNETPESHLKKIYSDCDIVTFELAESQTEPVCGNQTTQG